MAFSFWSQGACGPSTILGFQLSHEILLLRRVILPTPGLLMASVSTACPFAGSCGLGSCRGTLATGQGYELQHASFPHMDTRDSFRRGQHLPHSSRGDPRAASPIQPRLPCSLTTFSCCLASRMGCGRGRGPPTDLELGRKPGPGRALVGLNYKFGPRRVESIKR